MKRKKIPISKLHSVYDRYDADIISTFVQMRAHELWGKDLHRRTINSFVNTIHDFAKGKG